MTYEGYQRDDGLFDIEARVLDVKDRDCTLLSGVRRAGEPIHDMRVRVTIDRGFIVRAIEVVTDGMPYPGSCDQANEAYAALVGANLMKGFRRALQDTVGGVAGCTHITELLMFLPTAAVQTFASLQREDSGAHKPYQLDRCHALETSGEAVRRYYPKWYRGAA
ncbi:MAG TPA: DUF2889 domain-containing protein [Casimicrobiaceae bacterium]|nr:DUF2889 domain-containing protein [Casimicrobiaceae bacterium]